VRRYEKRHTGFRDFPAKVAMQLNDTHPTLAIVELMRILVDEKDVPWDEAWEITRATVGFTNHTLAAEALEKWPVPLLERVLPRHLQIIHEINRRFLDEIARAYPGDTERLRRMSLIEESEPKHVRMTHLAIVGSHSVNGVSAIHTELVKTQLVPDFFAMWPSRFNNKTNGVTPRAWLLEANPGLARLINDTIGEAWTGDLARLRALEPWASDAVFQGEFRRVKLANKRTLTSIIKETTATVVDPDSLFDVQVKRIHFYKRQLLKLLHIVHEYLSLIDDGKLPTVPRTYVFAGKAAPGYAAAKHLINVIHSVAAVIDGDARARKWMRVVFVPDYRVSLAQKIIPAGDLSEQISTAGTEASGTSNMKLALNGAVTIGTLDGANAEILEQVGAENMFVFGLTAGEVAVIRARRSYRPSEYCERDHRVKRVVDALGARAIASRAPEVFAEMQRMLLDRDDPFLELADLSAYLDAQESVSRAFEDPARWARMAIFNVARSGKFSSDRAVAEYARDVWGVSG